MTIDDFKDRLLISFPYLISAGTQWISMALQCSTNSCRYLCSTALSVGAHSPGGMWGGDLVACCCVYARSAKNTLGETSQWGMKAFLPATRLHWLTEEMKKEVRADAREMEKAIDKA